MKLFYRVLGEGKPLIILHGLFGSSDNWLSVSRLFAQHYKVYLIDQRNHGQSPHNPAHNYTVMAEDLKELLDDLSIKNPYLLGHSMGGKTVMQFVMMYPDTASKLIVVDIGPKYYPVHHQVYLNALNSVNLETLTSRIDADHALATTIPNLAERQFLLKNLFRDEQGKFHWRMALQVLSDQIENIGAGLSGDYHSEIPTLFIKGGKSDYYIQKEDAVLIHQIFPHSKIITIDNAGHWVQAEQPDQFYKAVVDFLEDSST